MRAAQVPFETTLAVKDRCLCLHVQRAARTLARRFDEALRPCGLTSQQFSLLNGLNRPEPPNMRAVAELLGMDRTTLTAALKPLERRGLVKVQPGRDRRTRLLRLTRAGQRVLVEALPAWRNEHDALDRELGGMSAKKLRASLKGLGSHKIPA